VSDGRRVAVELLGETAIQKLDPGAKYLVVIGDRNLTVRSADLLRDYLRSMDIEIVILQADDVSIYELTN
jgi:hypothetical protein